MDTKPPLFEGEINGMKLNSFIFQFEQYYSQKGYDLVRHDSFVGLELNQSVSKTALTWFERYMTDPDTAKTWSAMKQEMMIKFREPNFTDRMQNQLLTIRQRGKSGGYVAKFRDLQRIVCLDSQTTKNIFINGLSDSALRQNILRKQPRDLHEAIKEGFLECEIARKNLVKETTEANTIKQSDPKKHNTNSTTKPSAKAKTPTDSRLPRVTCPHYQRGYHKQEDCWQLHPEKRPKGASGKPDDIKKIYSMLEQCCGEKHSTFKLGGPSKGEQLDGHDPELKKPKRPPELVTCEPSDTGEEQHPSTEKYSSYDVDSYNVYSMLAITSQVIHDHDDSPVKNSTFIDSGATINAVSPNFCSRPAFDKFIVDIHDVIEIRVANKQGFKVHRRTIRLSLTLGGMDSYTADFLVLHVPEGQDILLGMPWLEAVNPDIDWVSKSVSRRQPWKCHVRQANSNNPRPAEDACKSSKEILQATMKMIIVTIQFALDQLKSYLKPQQVDAIFVIRPQTEKEGGSASGVDIESFKDQSVY
ncbi:Hypothetical protein PHPALM_7205 [Phytophthora palmivora]|uniref:Ty3 transposon capsid-like protein domain-containing protein n=1 Tax=Phytophthora palmivora TaxID=4796 RepID=A0A2P4YCX3_9STRA|nr:Hypothetical protein PHPALM_7205 [Phytophthora palmivora]